MNYLDASIRSIKFQINKSQIPKKRKNDASIGELHPKRLNTIALISILLSIILFALGLLHFYWVFGGNFGFQESLPTKTNGTPVLHPKKFDSAFVGIGLTVFGLFYAIKSGFFLIHLPEWLLLYGGWMISILFLLRAIGEFKYIGFFKSIRTTDFGKLDSKFLSPLCLIIGLLGIIIQLKN